MAFVLQKHKRAVIFTFITIQFIGTYRHGNNGCTELQISINIAIPGIGLQNEQKMS